MKSFFTNGSRLPLGQILDALKQTQESSIDTSALLELISELPDNHHTPEVITKSDAQALAQYLFNALYQRDNQ